MEVSWLSTNKNLENGIALLNRIEETHFADIARQFLELENACSPTDLQKLQEKTKLNIADLKLAIQTLVYVFKQAMKVIVKPTVLQQQLARNLKMDAAKAAAIVRIWTAKTNEHFAHLEDRYRVEGIAWELNVQTASSLNAKEMLPNVRVKMALAQDEEDRNIVFEMNPDELCDLYNTLENIQSKLDLMQNTGKS